MNIAKSLAMQDKAKRFIPGVTQLLSKRPDMFSEGIWPGYFSKAKGTQVWDLDGNAYIDMSLGGIGANVLGYCDPDVDAAVIDAVKRGNSSSLNCPEEVALAEALCQRHPWAEKARFARSGGEAMAIAVRIARAHTERDKVAFCGYHGWQDWYLAANLTKNSALDGHLLPGLEPCGVPKNLRGSALPFAYNQLSELQDIAEKEGRKLAAIVMEPLRNVAPEPGFIEAVRAIADELGAVFIVDEISAAFRLRCGGAHMKIFPQQCMPDMAVFSKALGNGYPIAAIIGRSAVMAAVEKSFISSTMWTERIGSAAALATIQKYESIQAEKRLNRSGAEVQKGWQNAAESAGLDIQVSGLKAMSHFQFKHCDAAKMKALFVQIMLEQGFLASSLFYAMASHSADDISQYLECCHLAFGKIADALHSGNLDAQLRGKAANSGFRRLT